MFELLLKNADVVTECGMQKVDIGINDGKISALLNPFAELSAKDIIDCTGKVILPGAIDTHAHLTYKEDFLHGTRSALRGGVTTVIEMPQSPLVGNFLRPEDAKCRFELIKKEAYADVALWAGMTRTTIDQVEALDKIKPAGYKAFMNFAGDDYPYFDDYSMLQVMEKIKATGRVLTVHAENEAICAGLSEKFKIEGRGADYHERSRPVIAELEAINRLCLLAVETGCKVNVCHVSIPQGTELVEAYRAMGADITVETCPQYLTLDESALIRCGSYAKCNPPLRAPELVDALWEKVRDGCVHVVGSDHSCYPEAEKDQPIWNAPGGFPGLDLFLPGLINEGIHKRGISWECLANLTATNAAKRMGLYPQKGAIRIGADADFAIVNPYEEWIFRGMNTFYKNPSSKYPYEGAHIKGKIAMTCLRGKVMYRDGEIIGEAGYGRFVPSISK